MFIKTSEPKVYDFKGKFVLRLRKYVRKGQAGERKMSKMFETKQQALDYIPEFRRFHEGLIMPPLSSPHLAHHVLTLTEKKTFKKLKTELNVHTQFEFKEKIWLTGPLTDRYKRSLQRAWLARGKGRKRDRKLSDQIRYLENSKIRLEDHVDLLSEKKSTCIRFSKEAMWQFCCTLLRMTLQRQANLLATKLDVSFLKPCALLLYLSA
eukprot:Pompholyxophrys_punicea_v1_NODE_18_length_5920_cov_44.741176.p3 type:complete len:208 gc:universal NODE_18_length_5920_cov_44.741176:102-725(+)